MLSSSPSPGSTGSGIIGIIGWFGPSSRPKNESLSACVKGLPKAFISPAFS